MRRRQFLRGSIATVIAAAWGRLAQAVPSMRRAPPAPAPDTADPSRLYDVGSQLDRIWRDAHRRSIDLDHFVNDTFDRAIAVLRQSNRGELTPQEAGRQMLAVHCKALRHPPSEREIPPLPPGQVGVDEAIAVLRKAIRGESRIVVDCPWPELFHGLAEFEIDGWKMCGFKRSHGITYLDRAVAATNGWAPTNLGRSGKATPFIFSRTKSRTSWTTFWRKPGHVGDPDRVRRQAHGAALPAPPCRHRSRKSRGREMPNAGDWRLDLIEAHPRLFDAPSGHSERPSGYAWCEQGWLDLLQRMCLRMEAALRDGETIRIFQIKEKFAGLRVYWRGDVSPETAAAITEAIALAEGRSAFTCEICGDAGDLHRHAGRYRTLCAIHAKGTPVKAEPGMAGIHVVRFATSSGFRHAPRRYDRESDSFVDDNAKRDGSEEE